MFVLTLHDRKGKELKEGNLVKVSDGKENGFRFIAEVKYLKEKQCIAPFHTFSFHSFEKVESVPEGFKPGTGEEGYKIWYTNNPEKDLTYKEHEKYLMDWRECEHLLEEGCFRIKKIAEDKS